MKNIIAPLVLMLICLSSCGSLYLADNDEMDNKSGSNDVIKIADYIFSKDQVGDSLFNRLVQFGIFKHDSLLNRLIVDTIFTVEPWRDNAEDSRSVDAIVFETRLVYLSLQVPILVELNHKSMIFVIGDGLARVVWTKTDTMSGLVQELLMKIKLVLLLKQPKEIDLKSRQI